jgi:hypothetical protein
VTWSRTLQTGRGTLSYRLEIERLSQQFVTHKSMANQVRLTGLVVNNAKHKVVSQPATADVEVSGASVSIVDVGGHATAAFAQIPTANTWLTAECTAAATTMSVRSTTGWASAGTLWIDSEAMDYTGITSTSFTGMTRGALNSVGQKHFTTVGALLRYPEVTNKPVTLAGARAWLYVYGDNDDPQGDGTLYWQAMVSRDPTFSGTSWTIGLEPLVTALKRTLNSDIAQPRKPRGIYYSQANPFSLAFSFNGSSFVVRFPQSSADTAFFENNADFVEYLNTKIAALLDSTTWIVRAYADGDASWHLEMTTPAVPGGDFMYVMRSDSATVDPLFHPLGYPVEEPGGVPVSVGFTGATRYYWFPTADSVPGAGSVPRGYHGLPFATSDAPGAAYPARQVYLDGVVDVGGLSAVQIQWQALGPWVSAEHFVEVESTTVATNSILVGRPSGPDIAAELVHGYTSVALPEFKFGREFLGSTGGNLGDFLDAVIDAVPDGLNAGAVPYLRADDFESLPAIFPSVSDRIVNRRFYSSFGEFDLFDLIKAECLLAGYGIGTTPAGKIRFFELKPPTPNALASVADAFSDTRSVVDHPIVSQSMPSWQPATQGLANQLILRRGFNYVTGDYDISQVTVRDVAAFGQSPRPRTIMIEPKSRVLGAAETPAEVVERAQRLFGLLAYPNATIVVDCDLRYWSRSHGDIVYITSPHIPDVSSGTMGVSLLPTLIIGREDMTADGLVRFYAIAQLANLAGYVPEFFIASETNTSGNVWDITIDPVIDGTTYSLAAFYENAYRIRVWKWDDTSPATVSGTISAVTATAATITLDAPAVLGTGTWVLSWSDSQDVVAAQLSNAFVADSDGLIATSSGTASAKVFS